VRSRRWSGGLSVAVGGLKPAATPWRERLPSGFDFAVGDVFAIAGEVLYGGAAAFRPPSAS